VAHQLRQTYAIALGSNRRSRQGSPGATLRAALVEIGRLGRIIRVSKTASTPALGPAGRAFANAVAILETTAFPSELLTALKAIERDFGRRPGIKWGPRVLDLDIILWSEGAWGGPCPVVPHTEFRQRDFVLAPMAEIAPQWRDPLSRLTVRQLAARLRRARPRRSREGARESA
jgi:2-amino-4-hydroxy-6-hydroxymethyldihydropteridine diphosphokinase